MTNRRGESAESKLRPLDEIQAAHDRLVAIILGEVPSPFPESETITAKANDVLIWAADVLCWVLSHEHNQSFADNLEKIDRYLKARGFHFQKAD